MVGSDAVTRAEAAAGVTRKAQLRQIAVRDYARLRFHARNCPDCRPGATEVDPPRINRACRVGMVGKAQYERAYQMWVDCQEAESR